MPTTNQFRTKIKKTEITDFRIYIYKLGGFKKVSKMLNVEYKPIKNV